jgi:hypothetical protein
MRGIKYKFFKQQLKSIDKSNKNHDLKLNFELIYCGVTFYGILNISARKYSKIYINLTAELKVGLGGQFDE